MCTLHICRLQENCFQVQMLATKFLKLQVLKSNDQTQRNTEYSSRASHKDQGVSGLVILYFIILVHKIVYV